MNVTNTKSLNVQTEDVQSKTKVKKDNNANFSDELKNAIKPEESEKQETLKSEKNIDKNNKIDEDTKTDKNNKTEKDGEVKDAISGLNQTIDELNKINQKDESEQDVIKDEFINDVIKKRYEELGLIDNNMNIPEQQEKISMQMGANMNFNSDGQPFAEFVNQNDSKNQLQSSAKDLAEEKAIMSTMEENIAIANKNMAMAKTKTVENEHGVHKIDKKTNLVVDTIVSYDSVVMNKDDVEFFTNLVENGVVEMNEVKNPQKASHLSKALADLLAKAMNDNKPIRIDFDNNISVIIKIDRAGKISADFLPSSQVAEAYLKENLPLLKQRFDDNDIDYNELNQRQRKQQDTQDNRKKGHKDE